MQRYRWPGHQMQLLAELQRQQHNSQFCDTLLQTQGISVPTHSCILAALSPYLAQKLSASPSPPAGQKHQLHLQTVNAQTLLKLVGLLYSGEVGVKGGAEQNDVLSAARQFGIEHLVEGERDGGIKERRVQRRTCWSCRQGSQVQVKMARRRESDCPVGKKSCVSTGTQTEKACEKSAGVSFTHFGQNKPPTQDLSSAVTQSLDFSIRVQPQNTSHFPSAEESSLDQSSDSVSDPTTSSALMSFPISLYGDSNTQTPPSSSNQQPSEFRDGVGMPFKDETASDEGENEEQPHFGRTHESRGRDKRKYRKKKHAHIGMKNLDNMKEMQQVIGTTQISFKVKMRRRTKGEVWEVVRMQDAEERLSIVSSLKPIDLTNGESTSAQHGSVHKPDTSTAQPATPKSTPPHNGFTPNQNDEPHSAPLALPPSPGEDSDEQIEKLLEDIMIGLNILPNTERDRKKSPHLQPSHAPLAENEQVPSLTQATGSADGSVPYQDFGTQLGNSSTGTGTHCSTAQIQPSCSDTESIQQHQQPCAQFPSSVTFMGQRDVANHNVRLLSESLSYPYPEAPTKTSFMPTPFCSSGQKVDYTAGPSQSSNNRNTLDFVPITNGNEALPSRSLCLPCMDDFRLPRCLSPLEPSTSAGKHQSVLHSLTNPRYAIQPQPSLHGRPWLTERSKSLLFPLNAITHGESLSLIRDTAKNCWLKPKQIPEINRLQIRAAGARKSYTVEEGGARSAGHQNTPEVKFDERREKEMLRCKQSGPEGDAAAQRGRKRKRTRRSQDAAIPPKGVEVADGAKSPITLGICSVSLSRRNVLAKERHMAHASSNMQHKSLGKPVEQSPTIKSEMETTEGVDEPRIRTRGFLKKTQETLKHTNKSHVNCHYVTQMACRAAFLNKCGAPLPKRKRGRPPKTKVEDSPAAIAEKRIHSEDSERRWDDSLPKMDEGERPKRSCKKQRRNESEVELIPPRDSMEADDGDVIPALRKVGTPKQPRMEKKENQLEKALETADLEKQEEGCKLIEETEKNTTEAQSGDGTEEARVVNIRVDHNHDQTVSKSSAECRRSPGDNATSSPRGERSAFGEERRPTLSGDVLGEDAAESGGEGEEPSQSPGEAQKASDVRESDTTEQIVTCDEESHTDSHALCQGTASHAGSFKNSACDQENEEEEEDEEEVDVLLYSPDKVPQCRGCVKGLNMDTSPEDQGDEDAMEVDVTGDEAE